MGDTGVVQLILEREDVDINKASIGESVTLQRTVKGEKDGEIVLSVYQVNCLTVLMIACAYGHSAVVHQILQVPEVNVNQTASSGQTALNLASEKGHSAVVEHLLAET